MEEKLVKTATLEAPTTKKEVEIHTKPVQTQSLKVSLSKLKQSSQVQKQKESRVVGKNQINFFGGESQKTAQPQQKLEPKDVVIDSASAIDKPNYDLIESLPEKQEKKIFKIEKQKKTKSHSSPLLKRIKFATFALLFGVLGSWTIYNAVELSNVVTEYNLKLGKYLWKLETLDSTSNLNDLFETYPEDGQGGGNVGQQSNWFDRFCNFLGGLFGG